MNIEIKNLMINILDKCNLNCVHCFNRTYAVPDRLMSLDQIDEIIKKVYNYGLERIYLTGGEPLLHPELIPILTHLTHTYTNVEIGITTNGILLTEAMMKKINECGNVVVQISVDGYTKETYEQIRGTGTFLPFSKGFEVLKNSTSLKKTARTCISKLNVNEVEQIYKMCIDSRIEPSFLFVSKMGNADKNWQELSINDAKKISVINKINALNKIYDVKISAPIPTYKCNFTQLIDKDEDEFGGWGLQVRTNGNVSCCQFLYDYPIGNIFSDNLSDMFNGEVFQNFRKIAKQRAEMMSQSDRCQNCLISKKCGYGCLGMAIENNKTFGDDGNCNFRNTYAVFKACHFINT